MEKVIFLVTLLGVLFLSLVFVSAIVDLDTSSNLNVDTNSESGLK